MSFNEDKLSMKRKAILISIILSLFTITPILSQDEGNSKCECDDCHQFDFWIGRWKVQWENSDSTTSEGKNTVNFILNGCVIEENFNGNPGIDFRGKSFSVFNHAKKIWQQTWVDNQGGYLLFTGEFKDGKMALRTAPFQRNGQTFISRMVFKNITDNYLDWDWQRSSDDGKTWTDQWNIHYERKKK